MKRSSLISVDRLTKEEVSEVIAEVRKRDNNRCLIHGISPAEVHELLQKSSSILRSAEVFQPKLMVCVCRKCHTAIHFEGKRKEITEKLLKILKSRYGYKYDKEVLCYLLK